MSRLRAVHDSGAFKPTGTRAELAEAHVPFSRLCRKSPEITVVQTVASGESVALVGPTGSGKSSLLAHIDAGGDPSRGPVSLLYVPMATVPLTDIGDPRVVAGRVVAELQRVAAQTSCTSRGATSVAAGVSLPFLTLEVRYQIDLQTKALDTSDLQQVGDAVTLGLDNLNDGHTTALAFDDTDRWHRAAGFDDADPPRRRFFRMALRAIEEVVPYPVIAVVHPAYLQTSHPVTDGVTDLTVAMPELDRDGLRNLIETRLDDHGIDHADTIIQPRALALIHDHYRGAARYNLRVVLTTLLNATVDGMNADADQITAELVAPHLGG